MPKLSVITASYMQEKYLAEAIDSVIYALDMCFPDYEIIIRDDASTDGTWAIAEEYAARYPEKIRAFRNEVNLGVADTAALMVNDAAGDYLIIHDHDDVLLPFDVKSVLDFMDDHPEFSCSYGRKMVFDEHKGSHNSSLGGIYSDFKMIFQPPLNNNALIMRRSAVLAVGNFQNTPQGRISGAADIFLWLRLRLHGPVLYDKSFRVLHRSHPRQVTRRDNQLAVYKKDYLFFLDYVAALNPELYESILSHSSFKLERKDLHLALMLIGGLIRQSTDPNLISFYLNYARQIAPDDPHIALDIAEFLFRAESFREATQAFTDTYLKFDDSYVRMQSLHGLIKCYPKLEISTASLDWAVARENSIFFHFTPEQEHVLNNIKKYDAP